MSDVVIQVRDLSKQYRIGRIEKYRTLRQSIADTCMRPFRRMSEEERAEQTVWSLRDVSFDVKRGEVVGIIGRNGAGKSTLLKILSRITTPTSGYADLHGRVGSLLEVGTGFHPELTGRENVFLNGAILGMRQSEIRARFDEIVEFSEIGKFIDTPVKRYSSGMYLKLAFAVSAHFDPEILVVDEVLAVGDVAFQRKCLGKMGDVARGGRTVLLVSHNLTAIQSLCHSCVVLDKGKLLMHDTAEKGVRTYMNMTTADSPSATVHFRRPHSAPLWMNSATILADGEPNASPTMGAKLSIEVNFESESPVQHPRLGLLICTADGYKVINLNNRFQPSPEFSPGVRSGTIRCDLGPVPLVGKRYYFSLFMGNQVNDTHVEETAIAIDVVDRDIWGQGRVPPANDSALWWPAEFIFRTHQAERRAVAMSAT